MSVCNDVPYVCKLPQKTQDKARKELNEDPRQRASQIQALRTWVTSQPHIRSRTGSSSNSWNRSHDLRRNTSIIAHFFWADDAFLLRFLRSSKFSQLRAQEVLENYWTVRSVESKGAPDWFRNLTPLDPKIQEVLDQGWVKNTQLRMHKMHEICEF